MQFEKKVKSLLLEYYKSGLALFETRGRDRRGTFGRVIHSTRNLKTTCGFLSYIVQTMETQF